MVGEIVAQFCVQRTVVLDVQFVQLLVRGLFQLFAVADFVWRFLAKLFVLLHVLAETASQESLGDQVARLLGTGRYRP